MPERTRTASIHRGAAFLGEELQNGSSRLLDRAARNIDQRPVVPRAQLAGEGDLVSHRLLVDIGSIVLMRTQSKKPVLPDLHDAFRAGE